MHYLIVGSFYFTLMYKSHNTSLLLLGALCKGTAILSNCFPGSCACPQACQRHLLVALDYRLRRSYTKWHLSYTRFLIQLFRLPLSGPCTTSNRHRLSYTVYRSVVPNFVYRYSGSVLVDFIQTNKQRKLSKNALHFTNLQSSSPVLSGVSYFRMFEIQSHFCSHLTSSFVCQIILLLIGLNSEMIITWQCPAVL